jgi:hypothetical protein
MRPYTLSAPREAREIRLTAMGRACNKSAPLVRFARLLD